MHLPYYCVKAFSENSLQGNPAGIVFLHENISKNLMQRIAAINGFPETVFLLQTSNKTVYNIWWFTPQREVFEAGHATLACQYLLFNELLLDSNIDEITLAWPSGKYIVSRDQFNTLTFNKTLNMKSCNKRFPVLGSLESNLIYTADKDLVLMLDSPDAVKNYKPNISTISNLPYRGLVITSIDNEHNYCCRFFAPKYGVNEDYTTASVHKYLSLYWMSTEKKEKISGIQHSSSPGIVYSVIDQNKLLLSGSCSIYSKGNLIF